MGRLGTGNGKGVAVRRIAHVSTTILSEQPHKQLGVRLVSLRGDQKPECLTAVRPQCVEQLLLLAGRAFATPTTVPRSGNQAVNRTRWGVS